jgi:hypothetical protein
MSAGRGDAPSDTKGGIETVDGKRRQDYRHTRTEDTTTLCVGDYNLPVKFAGLPNGTKTTIVYQNFNGNFDSRPPV